MLRMMSFLLLVICWACTPDSLPIDTAVEPAAPEGTVVAADRGASPRDSLSAAPAAKTYYDKLGVNVTWASDHLITGDPAFASTAFAHVRYFQMMEKDYAGGFPNNTILKPCTDLANPWTCVESSMRQHLVRVVALRRMFPNGYVWIAPEVIGGKGWPCKGYSQAEMGPNPEEAGYQWAKAALATYGAVGNVILQMSNEEWCQESGRVAAYDQWRRGIIRAHRENPSCELALGASHIRTRTWQGSRMPDNVKDIAPDIWAYLNQVGGWADHHAHGIITDKGAWHFGKDYDAARVTTDYKDFFDWRDWVKANYPNIRTAVGEVAYTTSEPDVVATPAQKLADWPTYSRLIADLAQEADIVFLYQIEDHPYPEGVFSGSGVFPTLKTSIETLANTPIPKRED